MSPPDPGDATGIYDSETMVLVDLESRRRSVTPFDGAFFAVAGLVIGSGLAADLLLLLGVALLWSRA